MLEAETLGTVSEFISLPGKGIKCTVSNVTVLFDTTTGRAGPLPPPYIVLTAVSLTGLKLEPSYEVAIGNRVLVSDLGCVVPPATEQLIQQYEHEGHTAVLVVIDGLLSTVITIDDPIKKDAASAVQLLTSWGIRVFLLTGDNIRTAAAVAKEANIPRDRIFAGVLPKQKVGDV